MAMQARTIIRKEWLTQEELDEIRIRESEEQGREEELTGNVSVEVIPAGVLDRIYHGQGRQTDYTEIMDEISDLQRLPEEQQELVKEIRTTRERLQMIREKLSSNRHIDKRKIMIEVKKINDVIEHVPIDNITELNDTFYACAAMVTRKLAKNWKQKEEQPWKRRLKTKVHEIQQDLSRVIEAKNIKYNDRLRRKIEKKFNIRHKGYQLVIEELKQRLVAMAAKIKRYEDRVKQYQQNRLFENNQKRFYEEIRNGEKNESEIPDDEESKNFWKGIWGQATEHDHDAPWIRRVQQQIQGRQQEEIELTEEKLKRTLVNLPNWKAPGPDAVQGFWIKNLTNLHSKLAHYLNECLETAHTPCWMTTGRTVLIQKDRSKGRETHHLPTYYLEVVDRHDGW